MNRVFIYVIISIFSVVAVFADSGLARFVFITEPQTINPGELSGDLKIQAQDEAGGEKKTEETIDLEFYSTSSSGEFLNSSGNPANTIMSRGTANRTFYYRNSVSGVQTLTVKAVGRESGKSWTANQQIIVSGGSVEGQSQPASAGESPPPPPSSSSSEATAPQISPITPSIKAYAGEDKTVITGSLAEFSGSATGLKSEPLTNARFFWNFGDGETKDGRAVSHIFRIPAKYIVGLHVSSGEYTASDYLTADIVPNQIAVSSVLLGGEGYIKLFNPSKFEIDIGGWMLEDSSGGRFYLPSKTKIGAKTEIAFANAVTGLLRTPADFPLYLRYPNLTLAAEWKGEREVSSGIETVNLSTNVMSLPKPTSVADEGSHSSVPIYREVIEEPKNQVIVTEQSKEKFASAGLNRGSVFFALSVVFGLAIAIGFLLLKKLFIDA